MRTRGRLLAIAALVALVSAALSIARAPSAHAAVNLTGDWTYTMTGDYDGSCAVILTQTGEDITGVFDCPGNTNDGTLVGTVTQVDHTVQLDAAVTLQVGTGVLDVWSISASVYPAGNTVDGEWESDSGDAGTITGIRDVPIYIKGDLNCDGEVTGADIVAGLRWTLEVDPLQQPDCPEIESDLGVIFGDINCDLSVGVPDDWTLLFNLAGLPVDLPPDCLAIGETYSPPIPT